jgi:hypothetical protein
MTPEEIARRHAYSRGGYELIGYAEVGLPVYELNIQAYTLAYKQISPLDEFTLRAPNAGLTTIEDVSGFLGLERKVLRGVLSELIRSDDIVLSGNPRDLHQSLKLTPKGKHTLEEAELTSPEERIITVHFDGLLRKPLLLREYLCAPRDLRTNGWLEIPSIPATRPEIDDLNLEDIQQIVRQVSRFTKDTRRDILSMKEIVKRFKKYRPGMALKYKAADGTVVVAFAIDGRLSNEHEEAFARGEGLGKLKVDAIEDRAFEELSREIRASLSPELLDSQAIRRLKKQEADAFNKYSKAQENLELAPRGESAEQANEDLQLARAEHTSAKAALDQIPVRSLSVYEHPPLLQKALTDSKERLLIISPWIKPRVVNKSFIQKLDRLLLNGVKVYIGYGIGDNTIPKGVAEDLKGLANKYKNFTLRKLGNTHAKLLLCDKEFVVLGSFNWLSFAGDPAATFRDEQSFYVTLSEVIDRKFNEQIVRFGSD